MVYFELNFAQPSPLFVRDANACEILHYCIEKGKCFQMGVSLVCMNNMNTGHFSMVSAFEKTRRVTLTGDDNVLKGELKLQPPERNEKPYILHVCMQVASLQTKGLDLYPQYHFSLFIYLFFININKNTQK